jgi:DNA modification methylase
MVNGRLISRLRRTDWDFVGKQSESPFSAIHWHPGRFASQLPATFIGLLSPPGDLVLDPFVGSGTALVEAQRLGRRSIGIDLNPIACLTARAKTLAVSEEVIEEAVTTIKEDATAYLGNQLPTDTRPSVQALVPSGVQAEKWYTKGVREDLGLLWGLLQSYEGIKRTLAEAAFSAILLPVCRETRHWGYVCDNSYPRTNHQGNVLDEFCRTLDRLELAYHERDAERIARLGMHGDIEEALIICADAREALGRIPAESVDLVVTSPPYFGVSDYVKAQRLSMEWFGYTIEPLRLREIGARSKRHRGSACEDYVEELANTFRAVRECLRTGSFCIAIVGESSMREAVLPTIRDVVQSCGFKLELDLNRRVSSQRRQAPSVKGEHLFVLSK